MEYTFAPMEGITYPEYRRLHSEMFPGLQAYYAPFVAPGSGGFKRGYLSRRLSDYGQGVKLIPQILANRADAFLETAKILGNMGFKHINLNAGCPSGTVFSKHKGSGMLQDLSSLDRFLESVYSASGIDVGIKTRMGVESVEEFERILEIYEKYPVAVLTVHARARNGFYKSDAEPEAYSRICSGSKLKLSYNGDIFTSGDLSRVETEAPFTQSIMLARGIIANPALGRMLRGGEALSHNEFKTFHDRLLDAYLSADLGERTAIERMKELWFYMICLYSDCSCENKAILKARSLSEYTSAVKTLMNNCLFDGTRGFHDPRG